MNSNKLWEFAPPLNDMEWGIQQVVSGTNGPTGVESVACQVREWSGNMDVSTILVRKFYFTKLELVDGNFTLNNTWASYIEFAQTLEVTGTFTCSIAPDFAPSTVITGALTLSGDFTSATLPQEAAGNITVDDSITSVDLSALQVIADGKTWVFTGALPEAQVDAILAKWVQLIDDNSVTTGTLTLNGGTNAAPSATGLTDKTTLEAAGLTVNVTP